LLPGLGIGLSQQLYQASFFTNARSPHPNEVHGLVAKSPDPTAERHG